jgi:hypothetical protein
MKFIKAIIFCVANFAIGFVVTSGVLYWVE